MVPKMILIHVSAFKRPTNTIASRRLVAEQAQSESKYTSHLAQLTSLEVGGLENVNVFDSIISTMLNSTHLIVYLDFGPFDIYKYRWKYRHLNDYWPRFSDHTLEQI